jgi:hypothetical protein
MPPRPTSAARLPSPAQLCSTCSRIVPLATKSSSRAKGIKIFVVVGVSCRSKDRFCQYSCLGLDRLALQLTRCEVEISARNILCFYTRDGIANMCFRHDTAMYGSTVVRLSQSASEASTAGSQPPLTSDSLITPPIRLQLRSRLFFFSSLLLFFIHPRIQNDRSYKHHG